jgi:YVTN family beta-propeller protein
VRIASRVSFLVSRRFSLAALAIALGALPVAAQPPARDYLVFVASEGNDRISLVRFGAEGATVERVARIGRNPTEPVGPHGIAVAPDGRHYYVSTAHGFPNGELWKFTTVGDTVKKTVPLGPFPATVQLSPDGAYAWVVNFNLHGDMKPSSVSVVYLDEMIEVARIPTCTMPHGSRLTADGSKHYSACMMDDLLVEIDAPTMRVSRHFVLTKGSEHGEAGAPQHSMSHGAAAGACSPTWAHPTADGSRIWVACNGSNELVEIDGRTWSLRRRLPAGEGIYNLALTRDGTRLVATNKRGRSVSVIDAATGKEIARLPTKRRLPSGVAISPDDRYAFVAVEGVGAEPGTVEVIDLVALATVATVDVGQQAGGVDVWTTAPPR